MATVVTGVLFALEREATPFRRAIGARRDVVVGVSGVGLNAARKAAKRLLELRPSFVVAAGFCGALNPSLKVGDVVKSPHILTVDHLVSDPAEKCRLSASHDAVDMESAAVEAVCAEAGIPFLAVRAVSDTADTALSPELVRLLSGGHVSVWRACAALVRKPSLLSEFLRLGRDTSFAARKLADELQSVVAAGVL